jgi:hypothetical protein
MPLEGNRNGLRCEWDSPSRVVVVVGRLMKEEVVVQASSQSFKLQILAYHLCLRQAGGPLP